MYSDVFCKVYNEFGWNYYPEAFGQQLLQWLRQQDIVPRTSMDLACGTGILCRILRENGIRASGMDYSAGMIDIARHSGPEIPYDVADMITYRPEAQFDLVTCTGDALNHIASLSDVEKIFRNVYAYTAPGGWFIFDILNENEVSTSEPFEMDFSDTIRVRFQMTRPGREQVNLKIRVYENGELSFEENIRETVHDPVVVCDLLRQSGFEVLRCADSLLDDGNHGTTWFVIARKKGGSTMLINGCHEGKHTPRLSEVKCPKCGEYVDVFVIMGGRPGQTGTLSSDEKCVCGNILPAGSYETDYEQ